MKVRVTLDISDQDRLILGLAEHGVFGKQASREFIVSYIGSMYELSMRKGREEFDFRTREIIELIESSIMTGDLTED